MAAQFVLHCEADGIQHQAPTSGFDHLPLTLTCSGPTPSCSGSVHHGSCHVHSLCLNPRLMFSAMKKKIYAAFRLCVLPALLSLTAPFAAADVFHVTSGISIAPGDTGVLYWNIDGGEDQNDTVEFVFSYINYDFGGRVVNYREDPDDPNDPLQPGALIVREQRVVNLQGGFSVEDSLPNDLYFGQDLPPLTTAATPLLGLDGFVVNTPGFIGFSFQRSGLTLYGWAKLTIVPGAEVNGQNVVPGLTISEWAYDKSGAPLNVPVPEPSITAILTLGTCGLALRRRQAGRGPDVFRRKASTCSLDESRDSQPQHFPIEAAPVLDFPAV